MNTILPIGSVVLLKNATKPIMIFGYMQKSAVVPDQMADYIGVPYPEGNSGYPCTVRLPDDGYREGAVRGLPR